MGQNGLGASDDGSAYTLNTMDVPAVVDGVAIPVNTMIATRCNKLGRGTGLGVGEDGDAAYTLTAAHPYAVCAAVKFHQGAGAGGVGFEPEQSPTLTADWHNPAVLIGGEPCEATRSGCGGGAPEEARGL